MSEENEQSGGQASPSLACSRLFGKITEIKLEQEIHCCGPLDAMGDLSVKIMDGGGGDYLVLHASEWAFGDDDEIRKFAEWLCSLLPENDQGHPPR